MICHMSTEVYMPQNVPVMGKKTSDALTTNAYVVHQLIDVCSLNEFKAHAVPMNPQVLDYMV